MLGEGYLSNCSLKPTPPHCRRDGSLVCDIEAVTSRVSVMFATPHSMPSGGTEVVCLAVCMSLGVRKCIIFSLYLCFSVCSYQSWRERERERERICVVMRERKQTWRISYIHISEVTGGLILTSTVELSGHINPSSLHGVPIGVVLLRGIVKTPVLLHLLDEANVLGDGFCHDISKSRTSRASVQGWNLQSSCTHPSSTLPARPHGTHWVEQRPAVSLPRPSLDCVLVAPQSPSFVAAMATYEYC